MKPDQDGTFEQYIIRGIPLMIVDRAQSCSGDWISQELAIDEYGLEKIVFSPGDIIIDVGAHVGMFSIYLAKKFPFISILAFEPEPTNFKNLLINLSLNEVRTVVPRMAALTKDARLFQLISPLGNSGGASGFLNDSTEGTRTTSASHTLQDVFESSGIERCKLLKIDCEGAEHEMLSNAEILSRVEWLSIEVHMNERLAREGYSRNGLVETIRGKIATERLALKFNTI